MNNAMHLHAQTAPHGDAIVIADGEALASLRNAIDAALAKERGVGRAQAFAADGEGYDLYVVLASPEEMDRAELPYTDDDFRDRSPDAVHPDKALWERFPAYSLQLRLLRLRAEELHGPEGQAKIEGEIGKPLNEITAYEASAWTDKLDSELRRRSEA